MYLVDTDVISNARKRTRANPGVRRFFREAATQRIPRFSRPSRLASCARALKQCAIGATSTGGSPFSLAEHDHE
jgi:hypothetical protein